ncbi:MAG: hypothetical protein P4L99_01360 [Chthoniobacter sp.]|nr:hypothetical protein [Chthoniobacter sp.]
MINYVSTPAAQTANTKIYNVDDSGFTLEAVSPAPDFAALIDTVEDQLQEAVEGSSSIPLKDVALNLINTARLELLSELLLKLLVIFKDSDNIQLDISCLISAAGLPLTDKSDSDIAKEFGVIRQTFSARKKALMHRLGLAPIMHSKSQQACDTYAMTNRKQSTLNNS